jgi:outer membrane biosynthesis protein TonB
MLMATMPGRGADSVAPDTSAVYLSTLQNVQPRLRPLPPAPVPTDIKIQGFKTLAAPVVVPTDLPPASVATSFDPRDFSGVGVEGAEYAGPFGEGGESEYDPNRIWASSALSGERPRRISSPRLVYPPWLRNSGIEGHVVLQFVIDTLGLAELHSIQVVEATHQGFVDAATTFVCASLYRPGRVRGRPVRVLVQVQINFTLTG